MKCPKCGYYNKPEAEVCGRCHNHRFKAREPRPAAAASAPPKSPAPPAPKKHLLFRVGVEGPPIELVAGGQFIIGREATCTLAVQSGKVSRLHAEIAWNDGRPILKDRGSSNGTFVGGKRIKEHPLASGDEFQIGPLACIYRFGDPATMSPSGEDGMSGATITDQGEMLSGAIPDTGLAEIVQGLEFNTKSGTLVVFARDFDGYLVVENGVPFAAESGDKQDDEAVIAMLDVRGGRFTFGPELYVKERRMTHTLTAILLEWGRRADEASAPRS